jgi:hypothetical protein
MSEPHYPDCYPEWLVEECRKHTPEQEEQIKRAAEIVQRKMEELGMGETQEQDLPEVDMDSVIPFDRGVDASLLHKLLHVALENFELCHIQLSPTDAEAIRRAAAVIQATLKREVWFKEEVR